MRLTPKAQAERYSKMVERLSERADEMLSPPSIATKLYPHLKTEPKVDDQSKQRPPVQGWAHLSRRK